MMTVIIPPVAGDLEVIPSLVPMASQRPDVMPELAATEQRVSPDVEHILGRPSRPLPTGLPAKPHLLAKTGKNG